jgi:hypothetical protein
VEVADVHDPIVPKIERQARKRQVYSGYIDPGCLEVVGVEKTAGSRQGAAECDSTDFLEKISSRNVASPGREGLRYFSSLFASKVQNLRYWLALT